MEALTNAIAGGLAAVFSATAVYPLDVVLLRYQTQSRERQGSGALTSHTQGEGRELVAIIAHLFARANGKSPVSRIATLYQGVHVKAIEALAKNFTYFYIYRLLTSMYEKHAGSISTPAHLALASAAGVFNQLVTAPLEVLSSNIQANGSALAEVARDIYASQGIPGFYRGFGAAVLLCANPAITNAAFDRLKLATQAVAESHLRILLLSAVQDQKLKGIPLPKADELDERAKRLPISLWPAVAELFFSGRLTDIAQKEGQMHFALTATQSFVFGAIAKALATLATYPYIRAKVLLQVGAGGRTGYRPLNHHEPRQLGAKVSYDCSSQHRRLPSPQGAADEAQPSLDSEDGIACLSSYRIAPGRNAAPISNFNRAGTAIEKYALEHHMPFRNQLTKSGPSDSSVISAVRCANVADASAEPRALADTDGYSVGSFCLSEADREALQRKESFHFAIPDRFRLPSMYREISGVKIDGPNSGIVNVLVSLVMQEGLGGLYKGLGLQLLKTVLSSALLYMCKERLYAVAEKFVLRLFSIFRILLRHQRKG